MTPLKKVCIQRVTHAIAYGYLCISQGSDILRTALIFARIKFVLYGASRLSRDRFDHMRIFGKQTSLYASTRPWETTTKNDLTCLKKCKLFCLIEVTEQVQLMWCCARTSPHTDSV